MSEWAFDYEVPCRCEYPVEVYRGFFWEDCGKLALYKGSWKKSEQPDEFLCQEHLNEILKSNDPNFSWTINARCEFCGKPSPYHGWLSRTDYTDCNDDIIVWLCEEHLEQVPRDEKELEQLAERLMVLMAERDWIKDGV